jgi:hypothetical protein
MIALLVYGVVDDEDASSYWPKGKVVSYELAPKYQDVGKYGYVRWMLR